MIGVPLEDLTDLANQCVKKFERTNAVEGRMTAPKNKSAADPIAARNTMDLELSGTTGGHRAADVSANVGDGLARIPTRNLQSVGAISDNV